mmetsp:Transcript_6870/g.13587  ORF Transcript_6870/g.13587 Transcript_6870/m.13587 type:complete len:314 (-) Transcript_6870:412-1353(-)
MVLHRLLLFVLRRQAFRPVVRQIHVRRVVLERVLLILELPVLHVHRGNQRRRLHKLLRPRLRCCAHVARRHRRVTPRQRLLLLLKRLDVAQLLHHSLNLRLLASLLHMHGAGRRGSSRVQRLPCLRLEHPVLALHRVRARALRRVHQGSVRLCCIPHHTRDTATRSLAAAAAALDGGGRGGCSAGDAHGGGVGLAHALVDECVQLGSLLGEVRERLVQPPGLGGGVDQTHDVAAVRRKLALRVRKILLKRLRLLCLCHLLPRLSLHRRCLPLHRRGLAADLRCGAHELVRLSAEHLVPGGGTCSRSVLLNPVV